MAIRFVPESNLAGAPSAPLAVEPSAGDTQAKFRAVYRSLIAQGYSPGQAAEVASQQSGYGDSVRSDLRKEWENRPAAATPETQPPAMYSDMAQFDVLPGDQPGTQRVWNPQTGSYETRRMPQADPRAAEKAVEQQRTYDAIAENYAPGEADKWRSADERGTIHVPRTPRMIDRADEARQDEYLAMEGGIGARGRIQQRTERQSQTYHPQWAREAGLDPNDPEVMAMPRGDLIAAARAKRNEGKPTPQQRELQWRATVMMRAGNHAGALALPGLDDNARSAILNHQNAALNAGRGGGPIQFGPNPLGVQAAADAGEAKNGDTDVRLAAIQADMNKANAELEQRRQEALTAQQRWQEEADARRADQRLANDRQLEQMRAENTRAAAQLDAAQKNSEREWSTRDKMNSDNAAAERDKTAAAQKLQEDKDRQSAELLARREREATVVVPLEAKYGPGVRHILAGSYETPEAQESLESMAAASDQSWTGFYNSDAVRLDSTLQRLGVADPSVRRGLVNRYGLGPMAATGPGGRSGPISNTVNWWSGPPRYPQSPPPGP
jgi:hypothetical protein